jgi:protocatechuate 3,4-dioxygenase beta subunit
MRTRYLDRRSFLKAGAAGALALYGLGPGCGGTPPTTMPPMTPDLGELPLPDLARPPADLASSTPADLTPTPACDEPTESDIEGPYYTPGAPDRTSLVDDGTQGTPLELFGLVRAAGSCAPLVGATIDVWHADGDGAYDNVGWKLRGVFATDGTGLFRIPTIVPGRYLNGASYRPRHIHVKVRAAGHALLTTQLYFPGDPFNQSDAFFDPALVVAETQTQAGSQARFDFVLA